MFFCKSAEMKRIDYVLVYDSDSVNNEQRIEWRQEFEGGLVAAGLELEREDIAVSTVLCTEIPVRPVKCLSVSVCQLFRDNYECTVVEQ